jgi:membrane associated rhomboid family serine protease
MDEPLRCYRHPDEETRVQCSSCGRPICTKCMITSPVGMRCPECAGRKRGPAQAATRAVSRGTPVVTIGLIVVNVLAFALERGGDQTSEAYQRGALVGSLVGDGEWWRIVTSGFLHANLIHIAFNMFFLYVLGSMLEPAIGRGRFLTIYFVALLGGSLGALIVTPNALTVGASGACFGLLGAAIIVARDRGIPLVESGLIGTLVINIVFSFTFAGISIGGHIGGLIAGGVAGLLLVELGEKRRLDVIAYGACLVLAVVLAVAAVGVARSNIPGLPVL